jgi:prolyl-tRNA synthetase
MIGGVIMTHGDDDGLRCPPRIAPHQIVIVPMLRDNEEDQAILDYCRDLEAQLKALDAFREPVRVLLDAGANKAQTKRWGWVKKGAPIIVEIGPRDVAGGNVAVIRRDRLYKDDGKLNSAFVAKGDFVVEAVAMLTDIQSNLHAEASERLHANIRRDVTDLAAHFAGDDKFVGWVEVQWARPTGATLDGIVEQLKALKLTMRNTPLGAAPADGACFFTGEPAVERVLIGRTY